ncbi:MAG: beta-N-acetylhexosaminidase [Chitinispirillales bacterium]|jgi:hypothetical protein|nr:beta-N-acetylhexosaminidase [Chitinispirillales bacterium]
MEIPRVDSFFLIPHVKDLRVCDGFLDLPLAEAPIYECIDEKMDGERYSIVISPKSVRLTAASPIGLFRARTTLAQLAMNCPSKIQCLEIHDEPDYPVRGFYHDVTRGRTPTVDTLKQLVDTLAFYKINHMQLYVEHSFAFSKMSELWEGKTPLTAEDIREIDRYCVDRHVDLVPSLSTFGHLYELLRLPRFEHLNELDIKASATVRCLWDRMAHYTLDVNNPESFEIVKGMIEEYLPLFSSQYFNICCDETFDLGKGKNAARAEREGVGRLYVDFVKKIMGVVRSMGKKPMLWGDIVLKHPELISELSGDDVTFLNWEYTPEVTHEPVKTFQDAGVVQYVCPGINGWSRFAADVDRACTNISRMARFGKEFGAAGLLNTDWGDCGQVNLLANSYHGLAFGADMAWNVSSNDDFDARFSFLQWGIGGSPQTFCRGGNLPSAPELGKLLRELGALTEYHFGNLYAWINNKKCLWYKEDIVKEMDPAELSQKIIRAAEIKRELIKTADKIVDKKSEFQEYIWAASAIEWMLSLFLIKKKYEYAQDVTTVPVSIVPERIITDGNIVMEEFKALWRARNRESELRDVVDTFEKILRKVDEISHA